MKGKHVKLFSDIFESLVGAVFMDSANFGLSYSLSLRMILNSKFATSIPHDEHIRTKTLNVYNSKPYTKANKLTHQR